MVDPLLEAATEWVESDGAERLRWTCPKCGGHVFTEKRYATTRCSPCDRIMQARDYSVDHSDESADTGEGADSDDDDDDDDADTYQSTLDW